MAEEATRISISLDTLRNELAQLELRLVDRIQSALESKADKAVVAEHDKRITSLELSRASREHMSKDLADVDRRLASLEVSEANEAGEKVFKRWLLPGAIALIGASWWIPTLLGMHH